MAALRRDISFRYLKQFFLVLIWNDNHDCTASSLHCMTLLSLLMMFIVCYNWNIVESGFEHHKPNQIHYADLKSINLYSYFYSLTLHVKHRTANFISILKSVVWQTNGLHLYPTLPTTRTTRSYGYPTMAPCHVKLFLINNWLII